MLARVQGIIIIEFVKVFANQLSHAMTDQGQCAPSLQAGFTECLQAFRQNELFQLRAVEEDLVA